MDKTKFCVLQSGGRGQSAVEKLEELGFTNIYQLQGGILKWDAAGLSKPITKSHVNDRREYNKLLNSDKKSALIDFMREWCALQKMKTVTLQMEKN
jgi:predicted sulfurtransferase